MDYLITNALEIMYLCLGFGFLILSIVLVRLLISINQTINKINYFTDIFGEYVRKPIEVLMQVNDYIKPVLEMFNGKDR
jgi:uncharacterized protein YoxC